MEVLLLPLLLIIAILFIYASYKITRGLGWLLEKLFEPKEKKYNYEEDNKKHRKLMIEVDAYMAASYLKEDLELPKLTKEEMKSLKLTGREPEELIRYYRRLKQREEEDIQLTKEILDEMYPKKKKKNK